jgi:hypothetical protein
VTSFILTLDTQAPVVTWGPVDGNVLGEEFSIQYALDEGQVLSAELKLADGRILAMAVLPDRLVVMLPDDAPDALATVDAFVSDDVGNTAHRTTEVPISGVPIEPVGPAGIPALGPPVEPVHRWRTVAVLRSRYRVIQGATTGMVRVRATVRYTVHRSTAATARTSLAWGFQSFHTRVRVRSSARARLNDSWTISKKSESHAVEEELLLVGIL